MQLCPLGSCLTAAQSELVLAGTDNFLNLGAKSVQAASFSRWWGLKEKTPATHRDLLWCKIG
jgi:hypothetical protein